MKCQGKNIVPYSSSNTYGSGPVVWKEEPCGSDAEKGSKFCSFCAFRDSSTPALEIPKSLRDAKRVPRKKTISKKYRPLVYLACPYTHEDKDVMHERFLEVNKVCVKLINKGLHVFSPISHSHPLCQIGGLPVLWDFWIKYDRDFLSCCHKLYVLKLEGWKTSKGVTAEIKIAKQMGLPIVYLDP